MHIAIVAVGSRGDVQPAVALGVGLLRAGHTVRLGSYRQFAALAGEHGLQFAPIAGDIAELLQSEQGQAMISGRNPLKLFTVIGDALRENADQSTADVIRAGEGADVIVSVGPAYYGAASLAEARGVPFVSAALQPIYATAAFPSPLLPAPPRVAALNRLSHQFVEQALWQMARPVMNGARRKLGLRPWPLAAPGTPAIRAGQPTLYAYSPLVVPRPPDWPSSIAVTGFWFLEAPAAWAPPPALRDFLAAGEPPVYIGFGSMNSRDPERTTELVLRALDLSGRRGLLLTGWGGLAAGLAAANIHVVDSAPHDWLFPRMGAVVHHGGSGTTAAGLRAGVPSVVVPFFADQPFWAARVAGLGAGPAPLPRRALTADRLARALEAAAAPAVVRRAAHVGAAIRAEDGVGRAVALIERAAERGV